MAQTEQQQAEEAERFERFRRAKARADLNARIALGQSVEIKPEELASVEDRLFRESKGAVDNAARVDMQRKQAKQLADRGNPPS